MMTRGAILGAGLVFGACGAAFAQTSPFYNGGFEAPGVLNPTFPDGWHSPGNDPIARRRSVGDGLTPAFAPVGTPGALTPRTGEAVAVIGTRNFGGFEGLTTDTVNFCYCDQTCMTACPSPFPFFDPAFDYSGGDVVVTGWYMIPASAPVTGDVAGIKLEVKVNNQPVATKEDLSISGHTNGQWVEYSIIFTRDEIEQRYQCELNPNCGCGCVPASPLPNRVKITALRFAGDGTPTTGEIYWDDISYVQLPSGPACDSIDFNGDGLFPDNQDLQDFLDVFGGGACSTGTCGDLDFNNDGLFPDN
ncbi:MAG TPA: hypothetical protein VD971_00005, partial [Phycisphaerales bacterium]|nr:hypothetical protein [Phycisphaerales bacterium]